MDGHNLRKYTQLGRWWGREWGKRAISAKQHQFYYPAEGTAAGQTHNSVVETHRRWWWRRSKYSFLLQFLNYCNSVTNVLLLLLEVTTALLILFWPQRRRVASWSRVTAQCVYLSEPINRDSKINMTSGCMAQLLSSSSWAGLFKGDGSCSSKPTHPSPTDWQSDVRPCPQHVPTPHKA